MTLANAWMENNYSVSMPGRFVCKWFGFIKSPKYKCFGMMISLNEKKSKKKKKKKKMDKGNKSYMHVIIIKGGNKGILKLGECQARES